MNRLEIAALLKESPKHFAKNSYKNCHAGGVYSIVLASRGDRLQRMFFADSIHELYKNSPWEASECNVPMSVGFHGHHCDIAITGLMGHIVNWEIENDIQGRLHLDEYLYSSGILNKNGCFVWTGQERTFRDKARVIITEGGRVEMSAIELHTIYVKGGSRAAWLVEEGEPANRVSYTYSNADLEKLNFDKLYHPVSESEILAIARLLISNDGGAI